jgi:hypothetical protein
VIRKEPDVSLEPVSSIFRDENRAKMKLAEARRSFSPASAGFFLFGLLFLPENRDDRFLSEIHSVTTHNTAIFREFSGVKTERFQATYIS